MYLIYNIITFFIKNLESQPLSQKSPFSGNVYKSPAQISNMPRYKKDINYLTQLDDSLAYITALINNIDCLEYRAYIATIYLTGARPIEMSLLKRESVKITDDSVLISIETAKNGYPRTLHFSRETPLLEGHILPFWATLNEEERAFKKHVSTYKKMIYRVSGNRLTPYTFRHHRMTKLSMLGAKDQELKYWKGARSTKSIEPYIHYSGIMVEKFKNKIM